MGSIPGSGRSSGVGYICDRVPLVFLTLRAIHTELPAIHPLKFRFLYPGMRDQPLSCIQLFLTHQTVAWQISLSMGFPRQEYQSGLPFPSPRNLPDPGIEPMFPVTPVLAGGFFTTEPPGAPYTLALVLKAVSHKPRFLVFVCLSNLRDSNFPCALPSLTDLRRFVDFSVCSAVFIAMVEWQLPSALM